MGPPVAIVILIGMAYAQFGEIAALRRMLGGVAAAAAGLIIGIVGKMAEPLLKERFGLAPLVALTVFGAVGVMRWPIYWVLLAMLPVSMAVAWWVRR
jgi:chromate transporter